MHVYANVMLKSTILHVFLLFVGSHQTLLEILLSKCICLCNHSSFPILMPTLCDSNMQPIWSTDARIMGPRSDSVHHWVWCFCTLMRENHLIEILPGRSVTSKGFIFMYNFSWWSTNNWDGPGIDGALKIGYVQCGWIVFWIHEFSGMTCVGIVTIGIVFCCHIHGNFEFWFEPLFTQLPPPWIVHGDICHEGVLCRISDVRKGFRLDGGQAEKEKKNGARKRRGSSGRGRELIHDRIMEIPKIDLATDKFDREGKGEGVQGEISTGTTAHGTATAHTDWMRGL